MIASDRMEKDVYYQDIEIHFFDCDSRKKVKLSTIMKYIADIAGIDYEKKGYTHQVLWEMGMVFLLSKVSIDVRRRPMDDEIITLSTWERGTKGAQFFRSFEWLDQSGEIVVSADTSWLLVNPETRKILRPSVFEKPMPRKEDKLPGCRPPEKLHLHAGMVPAATREVRYSDLDGNGHVYNAVYGDIAIDQLPHEWQTKDFTSFMINFNHEATLGDTLTLYTARSSDDIWQVSGETEHGPCFACEIRFEG